MSNVKYFDNGNGTVIKTLVENGVEKTYAYDILVGKNIPKSDSIVDYCYSQFEDNLKEQLSNKISNTQEFCSGTCAAMALAITYGDKTITPLSVFLWGGDEDHPETCTANWGTNGLLKWEQEDYDTEDAQMYDNRAGGKYQAVDDSFMENDDEYLKNLKIYLSEGLPVIIRVTNHFMVVVGVESDVKLEDATLNQLVVFDPAWTAKNIEKGEEGTEEKKIVTFKQSGRYKENNRMVTPYPIDSEKKFVYDEKGKKTHDPYYIDPVILADNSIVPAYAGRPLKEAIAAVNNSLMSQKDKVEIITRLKNVFIGEYESLTAVKNGEYLPKEGVKGYDKVTVNVPLAKFGISENGTYIAQEHDVAGFDTVTVNVPQNAPDIMKKIDGLPVHASLSLKNGFRIDFSVDLEDTVPVQEAAVDWASWTPTGGGSRTYYPSLKQTFLMVFAKFYKDGELMFAMYSRTLGAEYNKQLGYYAYEGKLPYISSRVFISDISGMTATPVMSNGYSSGNIELHFNYKKNWEVYSDGVYSRTDVNDKSDSVYFNNVSRSHQLISDLDLAGKTKALIELQVAFARTMGYNNINFEISNA